MILGISFVGGGGDVLWLAQFGIPDEPMLVTVLKTNSVYLVIVKSRVLVKIVTH